ncbi:hypothetical protein EG68_00414 [Paragonimus skrjabini miyazakii]|uniref:Innexin n=1 Tax=Paragonimus skrjabini miyazakii TaxID=59628 RepID=A0A8S9Z6N6_9TREM|nr:hypothetical protein EG68_00414 [Paragonimus skrjabini miyazakii]
MCFTVFYYLFLLQHSGKPIHCWTPQEFTRSWEEYAENYCWVASTYFVHLNSYLGPSPPQMFYHRGSISSSGYLIPIGQRQASQASISLALAHPQAGEQPPAGRFISYYQWAPILLAIQSFLFYLPCLVWRLFASQSGFQLRRIMQLASEAALAVPTETDTTTTQPTLEPLKPNITRLSLQNIFNFVHQNGAPTTSSFAPTKSVRTLARYLDMCLMRQRELRLANLLVNISREDQCVSPLTSPATVPRIVPVNSTTAQDTNARNNPEDILSNTKSSLPPPLFPRLNQSQNSTLLREQRIRKNTTENFNFSCLCDGLIDTCRRVSCNTSQCCCPSQRLCICSTRNPSTSINFLDTNTRDTMKRNNPIYERRPLESNAKPDKVNVQSATESGMNPEYYCSTKEIGSPGINHIKPRIRSNRFCGGHQGNFLVRLHSVVKLLYLCNVIGQVYLLEYYTGVQYNFYGIRVLYDLARGRQWEESGHFPRVTFCDFEARKLAQSHYYTLQCVLPINMFLEKIYIFLWLWFFIVGLITLVSIIVWISRIGTQNCRFAWIRHQLITIRQYNRSVHCCKQFVENHLGPDGVFILRLIAQNYGDLVAGDVVGELWNAYWQKRSGGTGDKTGSDKTQDLGLTEYSRQTSGQAVKPLGSLRVRPSSRSRQTLTATPLTGDSSVHTLSHKEQRRKHLLQTGYSATMMATEMIHPSDRFAVPLLTSTRKPPSLHSHDSSRYSRDSRERDRSESPPPIPQRSSDGGEYSLSDRRSVQNFGGRSDSQSSSVNRPLTSTREDDTGARECVMESEQHIAGHRESDADREVRDAFGVDRLTDDDREYNVYKDTYVDEYQPDDNIV